MKKIINGKKYDTETAKFLGTGKEWEFFVYDIYGQMAETYEDPEDFDTPNNDIGDMYQKMTGEFFIVREYTEGQKYIEPLTLRRAKRWCERNLSVDKYESIFGVVEE